MNENSKCQIQRIGKVVSFEEKFAVLEIEGKSIKVPKEKVAPSTKLGDQVQWNGGYWTAANLES
jgi:hypothetical protein